MPYVLGYIDGEKALLKIDGYIFCDMIHLEYRYIQLNIYHEKILSQPYKIIYYITTTSLNDRENKA